MVQDTGNRTDNDYVCMKKIRHRKSCKKRKPVVRNVSVKVKRQRSVVKRKPSLHEKKCRKRGSVKKTKSFIVKRKSFKRPRRWSDYIKEDERLRQEKSSTGTLPRIKGIWDQRKYKDLHLSGSLPRRTFSERRNTVTRLYIKLLFRKTIISLYFSIPRPKLKKSTDIYDPYHGSQSSQGYGRRVSGSDSGVYSSVSGYSSTDKILRTLNHHHQSPPRCDKEKASWRNLILRESVTETDLCSQFTRMYQRNRNYKRKKNKVNYYL